MTASTAARRTFVLETLLAAATDRRDDATRLSAACARLGGCRGSIAYLGALVVPEDELVLHLIEASTSALVRRAAAEAGLGVERVVESVAVSAGPRRSIRIPVDDYVVAPEA